MQGSLGLVYHLVCRNTENDGAGFTGGHSGEFELESRLARIKSPSMYLQVVAMRILTFSIRFGEFNAIVSCILAPVLILRGLRAPEHRRTMTNMRFLLPHLLSAILGCVSIVKFLET